MSYRGVISLVIIAILLVFIQAAFNCQKRPNMNYKAASDCCPIPAPNYKDFPDKCKKYVKNFKKPTNLCVLECFLNETKTLENGVFNGTNARQTLLQIFNDSSVGEAYSLAFEKCAAIVNQSIKDFEANGVLRNAAAAAQKCSPLAVIYTMCVHKYVYINCPVHLWKATTICENMKEYAKNCDQTPSGRSGKRTGL